MPIQISPIKREDVPGAVECIQKAFQEDPYHEWVFDREKVSSVRALHCMNFC